MVPSKGWAFKNIRNSDIIGDNDNGIFNSNNNDNSNNKCIKVILIM